MKKASRSATGTPVQTHVVRGNYADTMDNTWRDEVEPGFGLVGQALGSIDAFKIFHRRLC